MLVEGLSGGIIAQPTTADTFVCDLTGEVLPVKPEVVQQRVRHAKLIEDYAERKRTMIRKHEQELVAAAERQRKHTEAVLQRILNPPKVELIPNGKMKIAEIAGKAVLIDKPKWRRF